MIRLAQHREFAAARSTVGLQFGRFLVDDVLVLDRDSGHVDAEHPAGLACVVAGRADHMLGDDLAFIGLQSPLAGRCAADAGDFGVLVDLCAARAGAFAQRHREIGGRNVSVVGMVEGADDGRRAVLTAQLHQGPEFLDLFWADDLERDADGVGGAAVFQVLVHALAVGREAQVAGHMEAHILARLSRQALVKIDRIFVQLADRIAHIKERQQPCGMPSGPGGEFRALEEHDVRPTLEGEVVQGADAHSTAADDHHSGMCFHSTRV